MVTWMVCYVQSSEPKIARLFIVRVGWYRRIRRHLIIGLFVDGGDAPLLLQFQIAFMIRIIVCRMPRLSGGLRCAFASVAL